MEQQSKKIPTIDVGIHAGIPIDKLPLSYLRWMLTQHFPKEWMEIAKKKVDASTLYQAKTIISMHAIDRFSLRFLKLWTEHRFARNVPQHGIASFIAIIAEEAWENGEDVSKKRYQKDGTIKLYEGIKFVFALNTEYEEYRELVTVM